MPLVNTFSTIVWSFVKTCSSEEEESSSVVASGEVSSGVVVVVILLVVIKYNKVGTVGEYYLFKCTSMVVIIKDSLDLVP